MLWRSVYAREGKHGHAREAQTESGRGTQEPKTRFAVQAFVHGHVPPRTLLEVFVHQFLEVTQGSNCAIVVERQHLHHLHAADALHGIDPELGVIDARPAQAARAAVFCVLRIA